MAIPVSELQKINPSSKIELFEVQLDLALHGNSDTFRFHAGVNLNSNNTIIWQGNAYQRFPVEATGFEYTSKGMIPRPVFRVSNVLSTITALIIQVNSVTPGNDLIGAKFTRRITLASSLDNTNFASGTNPFGTPNSDEYPQEIFFINRKISETRESVEFELTNKFDVENKRIPARVVTRKLFPGVGTFVNA